MGKSNWNFYWLHFELCGNSQLELIPFVRYKNFFAKSPRLIKITNWHVKDSFSFRFLDKIISPCYASLCNERTKIDIEMFVSEQKYQIPAPNSVNMISSLDIISKTSISGIQQLSSVFRENLFLLKPNKTSACLSISKKKILAKEKSPQHNSLNNVP